jgi:putative ABC transport system permease protein
MKIKLFDKDLWQEVIYTVTQQKLRSLMTMFGVFWGVFMLVVLIGCGIGIKNGILGKCLNLATNSVFIETSLTTMPYQGLDRDRSWDIQDKDLQDIITYLGDKLDFISPVNKDEEKEVTTGNFSGTYLIGGVSPEYKRFIPQRVLMGRYINDIDVRESRKVCMIGKQVSKELFGSENPCGKEIKLAGLVFRIIGVVKQTNDQIDADVPPTTSVLLPITTEQEVFNRKNKYSTLVISLKNEYPIHDYNQKIYSILKANHYIHPKDDEAMDPIILSELYSGYDGISAGITLLIWIIGIGTLMAGLIGIANIMFVMVNERTQELGVRRALGARSEVIIRQIMLEALVLTLVAGISGIVAGVWTLSGLNSMFTGQEDHSTLIENPMIPLAPALVSLFVIVAGGLLAGYFPARRAMKIKAIEALREE